MSRGTAKDAAASIDRPPLEPEDSAFDGLGDEPSTAPHVLSQLASTAARGRLSHALLLAGPRGSGKRWCAVRLAQLLACEKAGVESPRPCRACLPCTRVERGVDSDVVLVVPPWDPRKGAAKEEIPVEDIRRLQESLGYRSSGSRRFVIVDPADRLSLVAQEALLKTLEEPPAGVTIALLTARASFLKPTVRSRSQMLRIRSPSPEATARMLGASRGLDSTRARVVASLSGGDVRKAQQLDPDEESERWLALARRLYEILGPRGERRARDLALEAAELKDAEGGLAAWLDLVEGVLRDAMIAGAHPAGSPLAGVLVNPGAEKAATSMAQRLAPEAAADLLADIAAAREDLVLHLRPKLVVSWLMLRLHAARSTSAA